MYIVRVLCVSCCFLFLALLHLVDYSARGAVASFLLALMFAGTVPHFTS